MNLKEAYKFLIAILIGLTVLPLASCGKEDGPDVSLPEITPQIVFLFSPGGLGDLSYNDCILSGVQQFKKAHPEVDVFMYSPSSVEEIEPIFESWLLRPGSDIPVIFALGSSDYEPLLDKYDVENLLTPNKTLLFFETKREYAHPNIYTFRISMYGASYLAGVTASGCIDDDGECLVLLGSATDVPIRSAADGFAEGFGRPVALESLADDWTGFVMAPEAYRRMGQWASRYGFIFPVAGGSNSGIYRYTRENASSPFLAGMDVDQSNLSPRITGSVVKHFDLLIEEYFNQWLRTGTMPRGHYYGLESGYVDWVLAPRFAPVFTGLVEGGRLEAVEKEKEYHEAGH